MFHLVIKDFLTQSKNKSDLIELLLMPFILIAILGFALGNLLMGSGGIDHFQIGLVVEQDFSSDLARLENDLTAEGYPAEVVADLLATAEEVDPAAMLRTVLADDELEDLFSVEEFANVADAQEAMNQDGIISYITIPAEFSYQVWQSVYFDEAQQADLNVTALDDSSISASIIQSLLNSFTNQYNLEVSIALATDGQADVGEEAAVQGEIRQLSVEEPVNAFQYYTIGMGVMFALSTAPALAIRAFREKEQHVFARIMLSGTKPLTYLGSKMISGTLITFVQLFILFILSTLIFGAFRGRDLDFWLDMIYTTGLYSLLVGGLTSLLTALSLNTNNSATASFFGSFVSVLAFLGGSFTPVDQFSETLRQVGNWTPNGAAMTSYLQLLQGFRFNEVLPLMMRIVVMTVICLVVAVIVFPKRRLD